MKASAFTGKADYYEAYFFLQDILKRSQAVSKPSMEPIRIPWYPQEAMADRFGFALTKLQYRKIRQSLNELAAYSKITQVQEFLDTFTPASVDEIVKGGVAHGEKILAKYSNREPDLGRIDSLHRAISIGRRKAASAKVMMIRGKGECYVNGRPAIEYFKRSHEMFKIADPFAKTMTFGMYNTWALVKGGGLGGQAGAIAQGIAKALCLFNEGRKQHLGHFVYRDPRVVERKKPGQPKARKKFTWVKR